jgi:hypothetical protein
MEGAKNVLKVCRICGNIFSADARSKFCSKKCANKKKKEYNKDYSKRYASALRIIRMTREEEQKSMSPEELLNLVKSEE